MKRVPSWALVLLASALIFVAQCLVYRFDLTVGLDLIQLIALIVLPGALVVRRALPDLSDNETFAVGSAVGFGTAVLFTKLTFVLGVRSILPVYTGQAILAVVALVAARNRPTTSSLRIPPGLPLAFLLVLLFLNVYNLQQFRFLADGAIVTRGLFGVDLPFLAGEIHGLRLYGELRDLHQMAQPWQYHDAVYQLAAFLPRSHTLVDLLFIFPLIGYTLLGFSLYALLERFTSNVLVALLGSVLLFLLGSFTGTEQGSYALSPSFVFGSFLFFVLLGLCRSIFQSDHPEWLYLVLAFVLSILVLTKLTTYLVLLGGIVGMCTALLVTRKRQALTFALTLVPSLLVLVTVSRSESALMPGGDFLIGAPLFGYANHVARLLHTSVASVSPVSQGLHLHLSSLLILPYFAFHFLRFVILDPRLLLTALLLLLYRKRAWALASETLGKETTLLLVFLIPFGFFLPVLYSPAWYPLALSFYAPLVSIQSALILMVVLLALLVFRLRNERSGVLLSLCGIAIFFGVFQNYRYLHSELTARADTVTAPTVRAVESLAARDSGLIISHRSDLDRADSANDESFYWYSALSGYPVVSEGSKYGSLLAADADIDTAKGLHRVPLAARLLSERRKILDSIYYSSNAQAIADRIRTLGARYLVEDIADSEQRLRVDTHLIGDSIVSFGSIRLWHIR